VSGIIEAFISTVTNEGPSVVGFVPVGAIFDGGVNVSELALLDCVVVGGVVDPFADSTSLSLSFADNSMSPSSAVAVCLELSLSAWSESGMSITTSLLFVGVLDVTSSTSSLGVSTSTRKVTLHVPSLIFNECSMMVTCGGSIDDISLFSDRSFSAAKDFISLSSRVAQIVPDRSFIIGVELVVIAAAAVSNIVVAVVVF